MLGDVHSVAVFLLFILPGYLWTKTENIFRPTHKTATIDVVAQSLTRSMVINAPLVLTVSLIYRGNTVGEFTELAEEHPLLMLSSLGTYALAALVLGLVVGYLRGALYPKFSFQNRLARLGLTNHLESTSVWDDVIVTDRLAPIPPGGKRNAAWVIVMFSDGSQVHGRVESYPQIIEEDKSFWFSLSVAATYDAFRNPLLTDQEHHVVMIHSSDVRYISVKYVPADPISAPPIVSRTRQVVVALLTWRALWCSTLALVTAALLIRYAI